MKILSLNLLCYAIAVSAIAQSIPSEEKLRQNADSLYLEAEHSFESQDSSLLFSHLGTALHLYQQINDSSSISDVTNSYGFYYYFYGDYPLSISYYKKALEIDRAMKDTVKMIGRLKNIGGTYNKLGQFVDALEHLQQALQLAESIDRKKSVALVSNSLGNLLSDNLQYHRASNFFHQSLSIYNTIQDSLRVAYVLNNLGMLHQQQQAYDSAEYYFKKSLQYKSRLQEKRTLPNTLTNLGDLYLQQGNLQQAEKHLTAALDIFSQTKDTYRLAWVSNRLATLYLKKRNYGLARTYLDSISAYLQEVDARQERLTYLYNEFNWYEATHQLAPALAYHKQWAMLRDSIFNEDRLEVAQMQSAYELEKEAQAKQLAQQETLLARAETKVQRARVLSIALVLGIFVILTLVLYSLYRKNKRLSKRNALLVREQHHRVKNNLQVVSSLLSLYSRRMNDKKARQAMHESQLRVQTMALIHRRLYGEQLTSIYIDDYLKELSQEVVNTFGIAAEIHFELEHIKVDIDQTVPLGLITNEVVCNACKHAFPDHPQPELRLSFQQISPSSFQLRIQDNGPGLPLELEKKLPTNKKSFGMKLIQLQTKQLKGKSDFISEEGAVFQLNFSEKKHLWD